VIPLMAEGKILPYLDIPFQHASPRLLSAMKRPAHDAKTLDRIRRWRDTCPQLIIRSTFIVGFPGETEADFDYLLDWLDQAQLDRVGCFRYEAVEGAAANELPGSVPESLKQERWERFMEMQQTISRERLRQRIGQSVDVIIDEVNDQGAIARSYGDAPEIDGSVYIEGEGNLAPGDIVTVRIDKSDEYDLWGTLETAL
jgi:ribosomal protein S12 methylthiotransferase